MFEQNNGWENTYPVSMHNLFINLCQFYWQSLRILLVTFWETLKSGISWNHTVNMKFNIFIQHVQTFFYSGHVF